jgi:hypothetical protein
VIGTHPVRYRAPAPARSFRPWRAAAALGDVVAAVVLSILAWWCWQRGMIVTIRDGIELSRIDGRWAASAIGVATLSGLLLLDAGRHALLAVRPAPALDRASG